MPSKLLYHVALDTQALQSEIDYTLGLNWQDSYREFICGEWRTLPIYNHSGTSEVKPICNYDGPGKFTPASKSLPYLNSLINSVFNLQHLKFARLVLLGQNSAVIPHRDYLELDNHFHRFHIPIKTHPQCLYLEEENMYHLGYGDVWYLDASQTHAVACLGDTCRIHLILDFRGSVSTQDLFRFQSNNFLAQPIQRPPMPNSIYSLLMQMSQLIALENFYDIMAILVKSQYRYQCHANDVFQWMQDIAGNSQKASVIAKAEWLKLHCILSREKLVKATQ